MHPFAGTGGATGASYWSYLVEDRYGRSIPAELVASIAEDVEGQGDDGQHCNDNIDR